MRYFRTLCALFLMHRFASMYRSAQLPSKLIMALRLFGVSTFASLQLDIMAQNWPCLAKATSGPSNNAGRRRPLYAWICLLGAPLVCRFPRSDDAPYSAHSKSFSSLIKGRLHTGSRTAGQSHQAGLNRTRLVKPGILLPPVSGFVNDCRTCAPDALLRAATVFLGLVARKTGYQAQCFGFLFCSHLKRI